MPENQGLEPRLIESWFPYAMVSRLVAADRRSKDPVYGVHKWFARRPPTLVRALLLASHLPADGLAPLLADAKTSPADDASDQTRSFWAMHGTRGAWLADAIVYDPFMGGGTSLVESARMGAHILGRDVDPIAAAVVGSELHGPAEGFDTAADDLIAGLASAVGAHFAGPDPEWMPLHWFWLMTPTCAGCAHEGLLYRDLVIATSSGRNGSVVRDDAMHAFCPDCHNVHALGSGRKEIRCCGRRHRIDSGTYRQGRYRCPECQKASSYEELNAAATPRVLIAIEETRIGHRRRIRAATAFDRELAAGPIGPDGDNGAAFDLPLAVERRDRRPVSAGYTTSRSLFTDRQWALFTSAFTAIRDAGHSEALERDLTLMLTGALSANNVLCGYARDWGRLAPLFSVRGFSIPALSVELNPFHPTAGRGTLRSARSRMAERADATVRRAIPSSDPAELATVKYQSLVLPVVAKAVDVVCRSADDTRGQTDHLATVCVTDPPYFDYIAYSELSEFFRTWLRAPGLGGTPLLPENGRAVESFAEGLGGALKSTLTRLAVGTPLVFTYHSAHADAWNAIGDAFDLANLAVVSLWPVLADPHMGHHASAGNCEWDIVVVARRREEVAEVTDDRRDLPGEWVSELTDADFLIDEADRKNFGHAWRMGRERLGVALAERPPGSTGSRGRPANRRSVVAKPRRTPSQRTQRNSTWSPGK